jgi:hypothetical protein
MTGNEKHYSEIIQYTLSASRFINEIIYYFLNVIVGRNKIFRIVI